MLLFVVRLFICDGPLVRVGWAAVSDHVLSVRLISMATERPHNVSFCLRWALACSRLLYEVGPYSNCMRWDIGAHLAVVS